MVMMMIPKIRVYIGTLGVSLILILASTSCYDSSSTTKGDSDDSGGVTFSLSWNAMPFPDASYNHPQSVTGDVCADYHIEWIHAEAIDPSGVAQKRAAWACADRRGTLSEVPVGTYRVTIKGEVAGENVWHGEVADVVVIKDQRTDAGSVVMRHLNDHAPPIVIQTLPADGALEVPLNSTLTATFDDDIVAASIGTSNFRLTYLDHLGAEYNVACAFDYNPDIHTATLSPDEALQNDTTYTATIAVDQGLVVEDMAGNPMQQAKQWSFNTFRPLEDSPRVQSRAPDQNAMGVALTTDVDIGFSEPILALTISADSIYLQHNGAIVQCHITYNEQQHIVTLNPMEDLMAGSTYTVVVTTDITDLAGYPMSSTASWSFVTRFPSWSLITDLEGVTASSSTSITLETNEQVHISFIGSGGGMMEAVRTLDNTWETDALSQDATADSDQDMVIDPNDTRHMVYAEEDSNDFSVCSIGLSPGGGIQCARVEGSADIRGVSLAVDNGADGSQFGEPSICYYDAVTSQLKYAADASSWSIEIVDTGGGLYPSVALAPTGEAHISYFDSTNGHLKYASKAPGGSWVTETVDHGENVGHHTDIVLDDAGRPQISYIDDTNDYLKYAAKQSSGSWVIETVDSEVSSDGTTSIALDSLGLAHISYYRSSNTTLRYAAKTAIGLWHTQVVDDRDVGYTGYDSAIIIDRQDHVHIGYLHHIPAGLSGLIRYATTRP